MSQKTAIAALGAVLLLGGALYTYFALSDQKDEQFKDAMAALGALTSYRQHVAMETDISARHLLIEGEYDVDRAHDRYRSTATTSLSALDGAFEGVHAFTLSHVALPPEVYVSVTSESELLSGSIPKTDGWKHFTDGAVPYEFQNVAVAGPVMDTLTLFSDDGAYLGVTKAPIEEGETRRYTLQLNKKAFKERGLDAVGIFVERLGEDGTIDVWFDTATHRIQKLRLSNPPYLSYTEYSELNSVPPITAPITVGTSTISNEEAH